MPQNSRKTLLFLLFTTSFFNCFSYTFNFTLTVAAGLADFGFFTDILEGFGAILDGLLDVFLRYLIARA